MSRLSVVAMVAVHAFISSPMAVADIDDVQLARLFGRKTGCLVIREIESGTLIREFNSPFCQLRIYPASTFKVALAAMGFDSGVLKDENTPFKWDGTPQVEKLWENDQTAKSWLKNSVAWYSQRITPQLGMERINQYLKDFDYGNRDFSGGITSAWNGSTLKISAEEQLNFLLRLRQKKLNISPRAAELVISVLPVEVDEPDLRIMGKTGTNFSWLDRSMESADPFMVGWYVGYLTRGSKNYAFALVFKDRSEKGRFVWAGGEARKIAVTALRMVQPPTGIAGSDVTTRPRPD